jgi:hypothetical protein
VLKYAHIPYVLACHLQIDAYPESVPDPAYHFYAEPDADQEPDFFMRMYADAVADPDYQNDANPCGSGFTTMLLYSSKICCYFFPKVENIYLKEN